MNTELGDFLRDLFLGAILDDGEEVQGIDFTPFNDGSVRVRFHTQKTFVTGSSEAIAWHQLLVPSSNAQMVQDRLTSVPSVLSSLAVVETEGESK